MRASFPVKSLGISLVVLSLLTGTGRDQRGSDEIARVAPAQEFTLQHVPCAARLVAGSDLLSAAGEPLQETAELVQRGI